MHNTSICSINPRPAEGTEAVDGIDDIQAYMSIGKQLKNKCNVDFRPVLLICIRFGLAAIQIIQYGFATV
jgi:hypothetical protein